MYDVFMSYSRQDAQAAVIICLELEEAGLKVFFDRSHITVTQQWRKTIQEALEQSSAVLVLMGRNHFGEFQQTEVTEALEICKKRKILVAAVLLPGVQPDHSLLGPLAAYQWFECEREPVKRLAEKICALLGLVPKWGGVQFGGMTFVEASTARGGCAPLLVYTLANAVNERVELTWQTFELGVQRLEAQIEAAGRGWHPILLGVNPTGFMVAARLHQKFFGGEPLGYYPDMEGHAGHTPAWPDALNPGGKKNGAKDPTVLLVDSELKSGGSLERIVKDIRKRCKNAKRGKPHIRIAVFAAEVTGTRVADLPPPDRHRPVGCPVHTLSAWKRIADLGVEALYIGCLMDGPGTRRPLQLR